MITTFIFNALNLGLAAITAPIILLGELSFKAVDFFTINTKLENLIVWLVTPLNYFRDIFAIDDLLMCASILTIFFFWVYLIRFVFWVAGFVLPWLKLPFFGRSESTAGGSTVLIGPTGKAYGARKWERTQRYQRKW